MIEIISALLLGILIGIITGLTPGLHINVISALLISYSIFALNIFPPLAIVTFIISMSIVHTFIDAIPSIFLGAPDSDQALSVQPGHRFLLKGRGFEALYLTIIGSLFAVIFMILISPILFIATKILYPIIKDYIILLLIIASFFIMIKEKNSKFYAIITFLLSGILGMITINSRIEQPLLPLLSGLFGISSLLFSMNKKIKIPFQKVSYPKLKKKEVIYPLSL